MGWLKTRCSRMASLGKILLLALACGSPVLALAQATVSSVSASSGYFNAGTTIPITITFNSAVTVTGSPLLALSTGANATCAAITNSATVTCNYSVTAGQTAATLDYTSTGALSFNGGTIITVSGGLAATLTLPATGSASALFGSSVVIDTTAPTLPTTDIVANNAVQPNTVTLTFSEAMKSNTALTTPATYTLKNNSGGITYSIASATRTSATVVTLTLAAPDPTLTATYITSSDVGSHLKLTLASGLADLAGNALAATTVTESGASATIDAAVPTVNASLTYVDSTHIKVGFSELLTKAAAETASNYTLGGTVGVTALTGAPSAASLVTTTGSDVTLTVPSLANLKVGNTITVTVKTAGVSDVAGNTFPTVGSSSLTVSSPSAYSFSAISNATSKSSATSGAATISGLTAPLPITVVTGSDSSLLCSIAPAATGVFGSFTSCAPTTPLSISTGDQIKLQLTSASTGNTPASGTISIGGVSATFTVTTAPTITTSGVTYTSLTTLNTVFNTPDAAISISGNGVVVVPSTVTAVQTVLASAPANTAFLLKSGGTYVFNVGGALTQTLQPVGGDTLVVSKNYTVDAGTPLILFEIAAGRATLSYSGMPAPIASLQLGLGTAAKQMLLTSSGSTGVTLDLQAVSDGTGIVGVTGGRATLRLPSSTSTVALADLPTALYSNEVATLTSVGKLASIRVGSVSGTVGGVGDALAMSNLPSGVTSRAKFPNLGPALERADPSKPLLQSLFDFVGSRTTLSSTSQGGYAQIPLLLNDAPLFIVPYGDVLVDTSRADGITLASDGHFEVSRKGVYVKLTTTVSNLALFAQAIQSAYSGGTINLTEDAAFEINNAGNTLLLKPDLVTQLSSVLSVGIGDNSNNQKVFQTIGRTQTLFPHFYDISQLATTFKDIDAKMVLRDNLDGTASATLNGVTYTLTPLYEVLSPIGGIAPEHRADPWWISGGVIYFKYPSGAAQGFIVR